ncbi:MAG: hypothetical protein DF280_01715 ['Brassica napus' phytoplasma]|nr:MAG: hypothetical protein DF280_01715 ['Brassica napus' phytoplasma]
MKTKLSENEFKIIRLSFGVPLENINETYQPSYSNQEITQILNLTLRQVENIKNIAINKLKNKKDPNKVFFLLRKEI